MSDEIHPSRKALDEKVAKAAQRVRDAERDEALALVEREAWMDGYRNGLDRGRELTLAERVEEPRTKLTEFDNSRELPDRRQRDNVQGAILAYIGGENNSLHDWVSEKTIIIGNTPLREASVQRALKTLADTGRLERTGSRGQWRYRLPPAASQAVAADPSPRQAPLEKPPEVEAEASFPFEEGEQDRQLIVRVYSFIQGCGDMGAGESQLGRLGADAAVIASLVASRDIEEFHHPQHGKRWRIMQPETDGAAEC